MKSLRQNQSGLVSITITLIVMILITLVVSSFAMIVRREQRRALDRQLSTQAFYAAESGVQDAQRALSGSNPISGNVTECSGNANRSFAEKVAALVPTPDYEPLIDGDNSKYSCILIDSDPTLWEKSSANPEDGPFVVPIKTSTPINNLVISWQHTNGGQTFPPTLGQLPKDGTPGLATPMLRITLMPGLIGAGARDNLMKRAHTVFLYPTAASSLSNSFAFLGNSDIAASDPAQGQFVSGECSASAGPLYCNVNVTGLTGTDYYLAVQPLYGSAKINLQAFDATSTEIPLNDAQAVIDVTGKAADVLRRIQVRVPIGEGLKTRSFTGGLPTAALETTNSICKRFELTGTDYSASGPAPLCPVIASTSLSGPSP